MEDLMKSKGNKPRKGKIVKCKICGKEFYKRPSSFQKYCSYECRNKAQVTRKKYICKECGQSYETTDSQILHRGETKYCSKKCKGLAQKKRYQAERFDKNKYPKQLSKFKKWVWKVFSDYIRERDNWTCFTCGTYAKGSGMHGGHFIPRTYSATLFDEMNVHAQCYRCNIWLRGNAGEYATRIIQKYGQEKFDDLVRRSREIHKFTYSELEELYQIYRDKLKDIRKSN